MHHANAVVWGPVHGQNAPETPSRIESRANSHPRAAPSRRPPGARRRARSRAAASTRPSRPRAAATTTTTTTTTRRRRPRLGARRRAIDPRSDSPRAAASRYTRARPRGPIARPGACSGTPPRRRTTAQDDVGDLVEVGHDARGAAVSAAVARQGGRATNLSRWTRRARVDVVVASRVSRAKSSGAWRPTRPYRPGRSRSGEAVVGRGARARDRRGRAQAPGPAQHRSDAVRSARRAT